MKAIELNGAAIEMNKLAFSWGRLAAHDLQRVVSARALQESGRGACQRTLDESIAPRRVPHRLPERGLCQALPRRRRARARRRSQGAPGSQDSPKPWQGLFKLMAYKDEYEVARLYTDGEFAKALKEQFEGDPGVKVSLAPPLLAPARQDHRASAKARIRGWMFKAFGC